MSLAKAGVINRLDPISNVTRQRSLEELYQSEFDQYNFFAELASYLHVYMSFDPPLPRPSQNIPYKIASDEAIEESDSIEDRIVELKDMIEDDPEEPPLSEESESCLRWFFLHNRYLISQCGIVAGSGIYSASWETEKGDLSMEFLSEGKIRFAALSPDLGREWNIEGLFAKDKVMETAEPMFRELGIKQPLRELSQEWWKATALHLRDVMQISEDFGFKIGRGEKWLP